MLEKDVVCLRDLDTDEAAKAAHYGVRDYYFDSDECFEKFVNDPKRFTSAEA